MPRIPEYTAPSPGITAPETGVEARGQAARRIGPFYHQIGQEYAGAIRGATEEANQYVFHQQIAHGALGEAAILNNMETEWENTKKDPNFDPNDPLAAQRFRTEKLEPALQKFNEGFTNPQAQAWALQRTEHIRDHFFEKTAADVGTIAAIRAHANAEKIANIDTNTAVRSGDIETVDKFVRDGGFLDQHLGPQAGPGMKAEDAERYKGWIQGAKERLVHDAAAEAISNAPIGHEQEVRQKWTDKFPQYVKPDVGRTLTKAAEVQNKANLLNSQALLRYQRAQASDAMEKDMNDIYNRHAMEDPNNPGHIIFTPGMINDVLDAAKKHGDAPGMQGHVDTLNALVKQSVDHKYAARDDQGTVDTLINNMDPASTQPTKLIDIRMAKVKNRITPQKANELEQVWNTVNELPKNDAVLNAKLAGVKEILIGPTMQGMPKDPHTGDDYANFLQVFAPEYRKRLNAGTLKPNDLDTKDPNSLISQALKAATPDFKTKMERQNNLYPAGMQPGVTTGAGHVPVYGGGTMVPGGNIVGGGTAPAPVGGVSQDPKDWGYSEKSNLFRGPDNKTYEATDPRVPLGVRKIIEEHKKAARPSPAPVAPLGPSQ